MPGTATGRKVIFFVVLLLFLIALVFGAIGGRRPVA
jgi:uncharacterized membrane protein YtjA (UPF0391 family)